MNRSFAYTARDFADVIESAAGLVYTTSKQRSSG